MQIVGRLYIRLTSYPVTVRFWGNATSAIVCLSGLNFILPHITCVIKRHNKNTRHCSGREGK